MLDDVYIPTLLQLCKQKRGGRSRKNIGIHYMGNAFFKYFSNPASIITNIKKKYRYSHTYGGRQSIKHVKKNRYSRKLIR